jgi:diacylglycerol kinase (ATP)
VGYGILKPQPMRAAVIFGLGTTPADLRKFEDGSETKWLDGLPASSSDADAILIFGGDGTIHRHLAALVRLQLPVLVVPAGSGNDFARALEVHSIRDSLRLWRAFESGQIQPQAIDLGTVSPSPSCSPDSVHYFCCVAGCGLDAAVTRSANRMPRWLRANGGYVLALLPFLIRLPSFSLRLCQGSGEASGETERRTLLAVFANTQFYGDGMRIAPDASFMDGHLDVCHISALNALHLCFLFPSVYFGQHLRSSKVEYSKVVRVLVETETPIDIYADGEFVCQTPAEISVAGGALRVILNASRPT